METVLVADLGTYCDNRLMETAIQDIAKDKKQKIVYFTDKNHQLPKSYIKKTYVTPEFFTKDTELSAANPSDSLMAWVVFNPLKAYQAREWYAYVSKRLSILVKKYKPKVFILWYPLMAVLWQIDPTIYESTRVIVLYCAPAFPNPQIPWIFDSVFKSPSHHLYSGTKKQHDYNIKSGTAYLERLQMMATNGLSTNDVLCKVHHVCMWESKSVLKITPLYNDANICPIAPKVSHIGPALYDSVRDSKLATPLHETLTHFISTHKNRRLIFITFGSYMNSSELARRLPSIMKQVQDQCMKANCFAIIHNGPATYNSEYMMSYEGFIPYETIVPLCKLVIFTGSVCLQNICLYHARPMLFVPILSEQYFWAKNYAFFTGVPFVDDKTQIIRFVPAMQVSPYLKRVKEAMRRKQNGSLRLLKIVRD